MLSIGRLIGAFTAGRALYTSGNFFQQLACQMAKIFSLVLVATFSFCLLLVAILYAVYRFLLNCGLSSDSALLVIGLIILLKLIILVFILVNQIKRIKDLPQLVMQQESPLTFRIHNMANAFISGLNTKK